MGREIERKFLVKGSSWKNGRGTLYRQGYLNTQKERVVRVRIINQTGFITVKGANLGASRAEYEYEIPLSDAVEMLSQLCQQPVIEKKRYKVDYAGFTWEIDEFEGVNQGLIVAEIELSCEDQEFDLPEWVGDEVTGDPKYYNSNLIEKPYVSWK